MNKLTWIASKFPFECLIIIGIVIKTALHTGACHRSAAAEEIPGYGHSLFYDVLINAHSRKLFEFPAQVKLAGKELLRNIVKRQVSGDILNDIGQYAVDFVIFCYILMD